MAQKETVERILDAAEVLFAERGFSETSLRTITSTAGVNLAAVNYHFGSKKALIQAVFERFLEPLVVEINRRLSALESDPESISVDSLLEVLSASIYEVHGRSTNRATIFLRLLGLAYTQSQAHLRSYIATRYGEVFQRYGNLLKPALPGTTPQELFWHTHFALGTAIFTMSNVDALRAMSENDTGKRGSIDFIVSKLTSFMAAGLKNASHG
ncbi:TetR/AcrR family transcriptional regulator [Ketobacter sp. MCCC 1A13808]|uniref:TetR/AcrR family transcriptional regulator n=1 Tax=Ketobacter sp. MCCC 1A13808 TaxID=2602738 RepID=UPI0012EBB4FA|nr:TetR/AcrR family transcriptional regulator [Ketobacter sp. MCCC 1A13808]MVF12692.1 TetR/AcrR family transcriptional regulator [Ketobacter sp. MCCC 1A13808]